MRRSDVNVLIPANTVNIIWELIPFHAVEASAFLLGTGTASLLVEEGNVGAQATVAEVAHSGGVNGAVAAFGFAAGDDPVDAVEVEVQWPEEGLAGEEADGGGDGAEVINAWLRRFIAFWFIGWNGIGERVILCPPR